ncbi:hypothetical protein OH492_01625 [Vibrio chagasii]|nr:hypothetical protein [Vibrio chagasii]
MKQSIGSVAWRREALTEMTKSWGFGDRKPLLSWITDVTGRLTGESGAPRTA